MQKSVEDLDMKAVKRSIKWRGLVHLDQLREDDESLLGEARWPKANGEIYYACATSGLLFDKGTGHCLQSSNCTLLLGTIKPASPKDFDRFIAGRKRHDYGRISKDTIMGSEDAGY